MPHPYRETTVINPTPRRRQRWASFSAAVRARYAALPPWAKGFTALAVCVLGMGAIIDVWAVTWPIHGILGAAWLVLFLVAIGIGRWLQKIFR